MYFLKQHQIYVMLLHCIREMLHSMHVCCVEMEKIFRLVTREIEIQNKFLLNVPAKETTHTLPLLPLEAFIISLAAFDNLEERDNLEEPSLLLLVLLVRCIQHFFL